MDSWDYRDKEDRRENKILFPFTGTSLGLIVIILPELFALNHAGRNKIVAAVVLGLFVLGGILHMLLIDRPIRKATVYEKRADYRSAGVGILIFFIGVVICFLRSKYKLY